jgi:hypothetical protein
MPIFLITILLRKNVNEVGGATTDPSSILGLEEQTGDHGGVKLLPAFSTLLQRGLGRYFSSLKNSFANCVVHSVKTVKGTL